MYNQSGQFYGKDSTFNKKMQEFTMQKAIENEDKIGKEISKEKCIESIHRLEEAKIHSLDNINRAAKGGKIPQQAVPIILEVDKARSVDKLFFDTEVDNEDIGVTVRK